MKCPSCGKDCPDEDRFCGGCGVRLSVEAGTAAVDDMILELRRAIAERPRDADAHYNLGIAYLYRGMFAEAASALQAVTELTPDFADAWERLGLALIKLQRPRDALTPLRRALELDPLRQNVARAIQSIEGRNT
jgi:tetratricopeptide (TPR) repeat protein